MINLGIQGILGVIEGIIVGRPKNGKYYVEYNKVIKEVCRIFNRSDLGIISNGHFGHAWLWNVMPLGVEAEVDFDNKKIKLLESGVVE